MCFFQLINMDNRRNESFFIKKRYRFLFKMQRNQISLGKIKFYVVTIKSGLAI